MMLALHAARLAMQAAPAPAVRSSSREMMSKVEEPKQAVARSAAEWAALWKQHAGDKPMPKVDLKSRTVVAVFLGTRTSAGYTAEITAARQANGALIVEWQERRPARGEVSAQIITSPAIIASIPKFAGEITFAKGRAVSESTSTGVDARLASVLCYAGWWVTGLVFLFAERRDRDRAVSRRAVADRVRRAVGRVVCCAAAPARSPSSSPTQTFQLLQAIGNALWFGAVVLWLFLLVKTWRGETWRVPVAADLAVETRQPNRKGRSVRSRRPSV